MKIAVELMSKLVTPGPWRISNTERVDIMLIIKYRVGSVFCSGPFDKFGWTADLFQS